MDDHQIVCQCCGMMPSLTSFLPLLAPHFGMTAAALYERQRALVRLGLLPKPVGRGRGSGALATAETVGLVCLSVLMTDNLSDTDDRVGVLARSPVQTHLERKRCRLTGAANLGDALAALFGNQNLASRVSSVHILRRELQATLHWVKKGSAKFDYGGRNIELTEFVREENRFLRFSFSVEASLDGSAILEIATALSGSTN